MAKVGEHKTVLCIECKKPYIQSRWDQLYCSGKCGLRAFRRKHYTYITLLCLICSKSFIRHHSCQKYCSKQCSKIAEVNRKKVINGVGKHWRKGKQFVSRIKCNICGKLFYAPPAQIKRRGGKYCSYQCHGKALSMNKTQWPHSHYRRGKGGIRQDLGIYVRSSWEANYARYLKLLMKLNIIKYWEYEPDVFEFPVKKGSKFYTPDFKIINMDDSIEYHEVKGYLDQRGATKIKRMKKYYSHINFFVIDKKYYYKIQKKYKSLVENWE